MLHVAQFNDTASKPEGEIQELAWLLMGKNRVRSGRREHRRDGWTMGQTELACGSAQPRGRRQMTRLGG